MYSVEQISILPGIIMSLGGLFTGFPLSSQVMKDFGITSKVEKTTDIQIKAAYI